MQYRNGAGGPDYGYFDEHAAGLWKQRDHGREEDKDAGCSEEVEASRELGQDGGVRGADGERGVEKDGEHWLESGRARDWERIGSGQGMGS